MTRSKWHHQTEPTRTGDLVFLVDELHPRNRGPTRCLGVSERLERCRQETNYKKPINERLAERATYSQQAFHSDKNLSACFVTKTIYMELVTDTSTVTFIAVFKRLKTPRSLIEPIK
ncbi:hypothetical protein LAZ67_X000519 [Cordylochernes scorpioides]|uniref:Uncharacterized protein n=1 Tax=Cordylochernes scorpioides TaxID=51811 RepID=A0ABY6LU79_9ARAC|nr:hypothetical protein LAZ67_X000519 [Cordylochernes scorpioides]